MHGREAEYARLRQEREEHIAQILLERKQEREAKRKMIFYLKTEKERLNKLKQEEEAREREGAHPICMSFSYCLSCTDSSCYILFPCPTLGHGMSL